MRKPADLSSLWHYLRPLSGSSFYFEGICARSQSKAYFWQNFHGSFCTGALRSPPASHLHVCQQNAFQNLALLSAQIEFLTKNCWERNVQADIQKARGFLVIWFLYVAQTLQSRQSVRRRQRVVPLCENTSLYKAVRSISQISNAITSCSKGKIRKLLKQSRATFGTAARYRFCFDAMKYLLQ